MLLSPTDSPHTNNLSENGGRLCVRVARREMLASDIICVDLEPELPGALPPFTAGAHIDLHLRAGLIRQYSLCNAPGETHRYRIAVLRDPQSRGGSVAAHEELHVGRILAISPPRNHFQLIADHPAILLAGGIGITPLLAMAQELASQNVPFALHYCSRARERTAFLDELRGCGYRDRVHLHFDDGPAEQRLDLEVLLREAAADTHLYVCGPAGFIEFVLKKSASAGWPADRTHREYFGAASPPSLEPSGVQLGFQVQLARSGKIVDVGPQEPVTTALSRCGVSIPVACEQGICGTCVTRVLAGAPDHRDMYFTEQEKARNDQFTPCCSRSLSPLLVIDV